MKCLLNFSSVSIKITCFSNIVKGLPWNSKNEYKSSHPDSWDGPHLDPIEFWIKKIISIKVSVISRIIIENVLNCHVLDICSNIIGKRSFIVSDIVYWEFLFELGHLLGLPTEFFLNILSKFLLINLSIDLLSLIILLHKKY